MFYATTETIQKACCAAAQCTQHIGSEITVEGYAQSVRRMGGIVFVLVRDHSGFIQASFEGSAWSEAVREGTAVRIGGLCRAEARAPGGCEIRAQTAEVLAAPQREGPVTLGKKLLGLSLESDLEHRPFALRHPSHYHRFRIQAALAEGFRKALAARGFQEVFTPKIVGGCAEGGAGMFALHYFGREVYLTQSPQLYKQMMVGVYGRVFEVGHVYRAELHNTSRHLNEYVSLDWELGFIHGLEELLGVHTEIIAAMFAHVRSTCAPALAELGVTVPEVGRLPVLHLHEARELMRRHTPESVGEEGSLSAAEERAVCAAVAAEYGSELVFVTNYHSSARPFYAKENGEGESVSFDLLFRGVEITTGGERIHEPEELKAKMRRFGMSPEPFRHYLSAFEYGLPPHGGSGTGLERLTMLLTGESNIRQGSLFPRDISRVEP